MSRGAVSRVKFIAGLSCINDEFLSPWATGSIDFFGVLQKKKKKKLQVLSRVFTKFSREIIFDGLRIGRENLRMVL